MPVDLCLNAESCSCEDFRLFLEGSSHKHEQTQFGGIHNFFLFFLSSYNLLVARSFTWKHLTGKREKLWAQESSRGIQD